MLLDLISSMFTGLTTLSNMGQKGFYKPRAHLTCLLGCKRHSKSFKVTTKAIKTKVKEVFNKASSQFLHQPTHPLNPIHPLPAMLCSVKGAVEPSFRSEFVEGSKRIPTQRGPPFLRTAWEWAETPSVET